MLVISTAYDDGVAEAYEPGSVFDDAKNFVEEDRCGIRLNQRRRTTAGAEAFFGDRRERDELHA